MVVDGQGFRKTIQQFSAPYDEFDRPVVNCETFVVEGFWRHKEESESKFKSGSKDQEVSFPRYAAITFGSLRISDGVPSAIFFP